MANKAGLGLSPITEKIYFGKQNPVKRMWVGKKEDVTDSFIDTMFEYVKKDEVREIVTENDVEGEVTHFFLHSTKNKESITKMINFLNKELEKINK